MAVAYTQHQGSTYNQAITAAGSTNTKGAYTTLVASLATDVDGFYLFVSTTGAASRSYLLDIATGGAGSETVVVANLPFQVGGDVTGANCCVFVPFPLSAGTRVSASCQSATASATISISLMTVKGGIAGVLTSPVSFTYGANTATTRGTQVDPGGTISTKGAYVQLTAATVTTNNLQWLLVMLGNQLNTAMAAANFALDIATGAAASETVIIPDIIFASGTVFDGLLPSAFCFQVDIPTGTRIAARAKCSSNDATDRLIDLVVVGIEGVSTIGTSRAAGMLANGGLAR